MRFFARLRLAASGRFYICDEVNYGLFKINPDSDPPTAELNFLGLDNIVRHSVTIPADV
ncbi:MAG: hypothetical protein QGF09_11450 [Rhodospirillales bacterium]|jgi:hypothetical protein|nr:hypothetical protein [Rhodospirillales bacterium]